MLDAAIHGTVLCHQNTNHLVSCCCFVCVFGRGFPVPFKINYTKKEPFVTWPPGGQGETLLRQLPLVESEKCSFDKIADPPLIGLTSGEVKNLTGRRPWSFDAPSLLIQLAMFPAFRTSGAKAQVNLKHWPWALFAPDRRAHGWKKDERGSELRKGR